MRLCPGSSGMPLGTAQEASASSCSRRRSQCSRRAWCSCTTKRAVPPRASSSEDSENVSGAGSGVCAKLRLRRYSPRLPGLAVSVTLMHSSTYPHRADLIRPANAHTANPHYQAPHTSLNCPRSPETCVRDVPRHNKSGRGGIRTPVGGKPPETVFETAAFNRSATLPRIKLHVTGDAWNSGTAAPGRRSGIEWPISTEAVFGEMPAASSRRARHSPREDLDFCSDEKESVCDPRGASSVEERPADDPEKGLVPNPFISTGSQRRHSRRRCQDSASGPLI